MELIRLSSMDIPDVGLLTVQPGFIRSVILIIHSLFSEPLTIYPSSTKVSTASGYVPLQPLFEVYRITPLVTPCTTCGVRRFSLIEPLRSPTPSSDETIFVVQSTGDTATVSVDSCKR